MFYKRALEQIVIVFMGLVYTPYCQQRPKPAIINLPCTRKGGVAQWVACARLAQQLGSYSSSPCKTNEFLGKRDLRATGNADGSAHRAVGGVFFALARSRIGVDTANGTLSVACVCPAIGPKTPGFQRQIVVNISPNHYYYVRFNRARRGFQQA